MKKRDTENMPPEQVELYDAVQAGLNRDIAPLDRVERTVKATRALLDQHFAWMLMLCKEAKAGGNLDLATNVFSYQEDLVKWAADHPFYKQMPSGRAGEYEISFDELKERSK